jgi:hypothetical protein
MAFNEFDDEGTEGANVNIVDPNNPANKAKVDEFGNQYSNVQYQKNSQLDAWSRLRTSLPYTLFELNFTTSSQPLNMNTQLTTGGTSVFDYDSAGVLMGVPTTNGASVVRQTKRYFRYLTGKGVSVLVANRSNLTKLGLFQAWGYFDINDGWFFQYTSTGLAAVVRSSTSGSPVDIVINQSDWNLDKLDGTGNSGITIDPTKYNVWVLDYAWQGVGGVRFGVFYNGVVTYCHEYRPANTLQVNYTRTPVLPVRYEIRNTATTPSSSTMLQGTLGIVVDGSGQPIDPSLQFSVSNKQTGINVGTTLRPILSIRPKLLFNGNVNRVPVQVTNVTVSTETQILYYQVLKNVTLTGASFVSDGVNTAVEYDVSATSFSGGEKLAEGYVLASSQGNSRNLAVSSTILNKLNFLSLDIEGNAAEHVTVVARTITSTSLTFANIEWEEFQ